MEETDQHGGIGNTVPGQKACNDEGRSVAVTPRSVNDLCKTLEALDKAYETVHY